MKSNSILSPDSLFCLVAVMLLFLPLHAGARSFPGKARFFSEDFESIRTNSGNGNRDSSITADDCRFCHEDLDRFPGLGQTNTDKHHLLVGEEIPQLSIVPFQTPGIRYECLSCHPVEQVDVNAFTISVERDCLQCHPVETVTGSPRYDNVHHEQPNYTCFDCHGTGQR